jgi:hypothetical protein
MLLRLILTIIGVLLILAICSDLSGKNNEKGQKLSFAEMKHIKTEIIPTIPNQIRIAKELSIFEMREIKGKGDPDCLSLGDCHSRARDEGRLIEGCAGKVPDPDGTLPTCWRCVGTDLTEWRDCLFPGGWWGIPCQRWDVTCGAYYQGQCIGNDCRLFENQSNDCSDVANCRDWWW